MVPQRHKLNEDTNNLGNFTPSERIQTAEDLGVHELKSTNGLYLAKLQGHQGSQ